MVARFTVQMINGVPTTVGSTQASGLAQFTTNAAVTNDRYAPHISRMCQPSQPDECRRRTAHPASAAASVATAISPSHHSRPGASAARPSALAVITATAPW